MFFAAADTLGFTTAGSERMRIDSSGNLLVGKTATTFSATGIENRADGRITSTRSGNTNMLLNRLSSDGSLIDCYKDGTTVGSIGVIHGNNLFIGAPSHSGLQFGTSVVYPTGGSTGDANDATIDIGASSQRFKTLYLSNTAIFGGAGMSIGVSTLGDANDGMINGPSNNDLIINSRPNSTTEGTLFYINGTERMRIDNSGSLLVGTTSSYADSYHTIAKNVNDDSNDAVLNVVNLDTTAAAQNTVLAVTASDAVFSGVRAIDFRTAGGTIASITMGNSGVAYNTSSDARLKDITGSARGLEVINELNPVSYNWKADGKADEGLIAQEVMDIVPNAVSGSEEEMYSMDYSKLVVHLVAGMKEQQTIIDDLKTRIETLENV
jgi:hypothetical protein